jgi:hypothetical protein
MSSGRLGPSFTVDPILDSLENSCLQYQISFDAGVRQHHLCRFVMQY